MTASAYRQSGAALVITLIMLLLMTVLGLSSSNVGILQERMTSNVQDTNLAFQRAEETLRDIEQRLRLLARGQTGGLGVIPLWSGLNLEVGDCTLSNTPAAWNGLRDAPWRAALTAGQNTEFLLVDLGGATLGDGTVITSGCTPMSEQPSPRGQYFLIAVRAPGNFGTTEVILQSVFYWP